MEVVQSRGDQMWINAPEPTQAQRDKGNEMAARVLMRVREAARQKERERAAELIPTDELSQEELVAYANGLLE